jgi:hypothetical protein
LRPDVAAAIMIHGMLEGLLTGPAHHQRDGLIVGHCEGFLAALTLGGWNKY